MKTKICSKCKKELLIIEFRKDKRYIDNLYSNCKLCESKAQKSCYLKKRKQYIKRINKQQKAKHRKESNYDELYKKQNGCCFICGVHQSQLEYSLCVDHNHISNNIRGLLCRVCNLGIGNLKVDEYGVDLLLKAIDYLKETDFA